MSDDDDSPRLFRRERNLSNRNFARRGSRRRISNKSQQSSTDNESEHNASINKHNRNINNNNNDNDNSSSSISSSLQLTYSVHTESENAFNKKSLLKMRSAGSDDVVDGDGGEDALNVPATKVESPVTPDPALMDVKQKVLRFETLRAEERIIFKTGKFKTKSLQSIAAAAAVMNHNNSNNSSSSDASRLFGPLRVLPTLVRQPSSSTMTAEKVSSETSTTTTTTRTTPPTPNASFLHTHSINEERSEDEVAEISADEADEGQSYTLPEEVLEIHEDLVPSPVPGFESQTEQDFNTNAQEYGIDDFGKVEAVRVSTRSGSVGVASKVKPGTDFPRNYRTIPRRKTDTNFTINRHLVSKFHSVYQPKENETDEVELEEDEIELRNKSEKFISPILDELIKTEETYVDNLIVGLKNYGNIFQRKDLPIGLRGKKYVLLGNIEQILEFHRDHFLPMLLRNRRDLKRLFDEFQHYIDQNDFYGYVIFTMNKQKSLKLCEVYKSYFKLIQMELDDKLGINSFLVQPIQRMARYPLLLQQFITTLFKHRECVDKSQIESCCRLEKKMRTLLTTTNESEIINDIIDCNEFNVFYQGKFRKVSEFNVFDHTLKRHYHAKVFIFDKCIIYTEIKGKSLVFHGRYPCEHIGIQAKPKSFTLYYERRKQQECDFSGDPMLIEMWLELIREMVQSFVTEERAKLLESYSHEHDHQHRKPTSLSLFRDSNRFSTDSGIGNIWVMPKPDAEETGVSNRTTWYAVT